MDNGIKIGIGSFIATAALLALPHGADARGGHGDRPATRAELETRIGTRFAAMDADSDGTVTRAEAEAYRDARRAERRERMFARLDADGDGSISAEERAAMRGHRHHRRHARLGRPEESPMRARLTAEEMEPLTEAAGEDAIQAPPEREARRARRAERHTAMWAAADSDGDGALSRAEFDAAVAARRHARHGDRPDRFARADADGNGALTLAEVSARALARFDAVDADGDGELTQEERRAAWQARRAARREARDN